MTTISTPPTAPSRSNPSTFSVRADAFVAWIETAVGEFNIVAGEVNTNATAAASAKTAAEAARDAALDAEAGALAGASYAGAWSGLTGALTMPATVKHSDALWTLDTDLADVTASEPGVSGDWTELYDLNVLAVSVYGVSEASKVVTADANGNVKFSEEIQAKAYIGTVAALSGTTPTINCNVANAFTLTTSGNTTITLDASGIDLDTNEEWTGKLEITAGGTHTLAFSAGGGSVKFARGIQPSAPASGETDVYVITTSDGVNFTVLSVLSGAVVAPPAFQDAAWYANHKTKRYFRNSGSGLLPVTFSDLFTYTRASTATYIDESGVLQTAAVDEPRYDWTGGKRRLLIEPTATNLIPDNSAASAAFSWVQGVDWVQDTALAPDGVSQADKLVANDGDTFHYTRVNGYGVDNTPFTFSVCLKAAELDAVSLSVFDTNATSNRLRAKLDLATGEIYYSSVIGNAVFLGMKARPLTDGWVLFSVSGIANTLGTGGSIRVQLLVLKNKSDSFLGDGVEGVHVWLPDLKQEAVYSTPIKTYGTPATRAADLLQIDGAKMSTILGGAMPDAVSLYMRGTMDYADEGTTNQVVWVSWNSGSGSITQRMQTNSSLTGLPGFIQFDGTTTSEINGATDHYAPGLNVPFSIASRHGATFINGAVDGTVLTADLTPTSLADLHATALKLATTGVLRIEEFALFASDIGDTRLGEITS